MTRAVPGAAVEAAHLVRRFFGSLSPAPPPPGDEAWARAVLLPGEVAIWEQMSNPDRRHAVGVARAVADRWPTVEAEHAGTEPGREVLAAALLHDSGKVASGLGTLARVGATLWWAVADKQLAARWAAPDVTGIRGRLGRYRRHPELGAELLRQAGSDPLTADWAAQHHRPEADWTVPVPIGRLLKDCDDD